MKSAPSTSERVADRRRWIRRITVTASLAAVLVLALPPSVNWAAPAPVRFHQFDLARIEARFGALSAAELFRTCRSFYAAGWNRLGGGHPAPPGFDDAPRVFDYVFSWIPSYAVVHPTEQFYYFRMVLAGREVWGNVRLGDFALGRLMFSYFSAPISAGHARTLTITERDGLRIDRHAEDLVDVRWRGRTVRFRIADLGRAAPRRLSLLPEEEFAGHVHDESGLKFFLLFNRDTRAFYYVLDEENGTPEEFQDLGAGLRFGRRTEFVFFQDDEASRRILVGVSQRNIEANNFFDGPGDQVPIGLDLRDRIYQAYPSARLGQGIDEHGVILGRPAWCRYVIGAYQPYGSVTEITGRVRRVGPGLSKGRAWTALTREWWWTRTFVETTRAKLLAEGKPAEMPWLAIPETE